MFCNSGLLADGEGRSHDSGMESLESGTLAIDPVEFGHRVTQLRSLAGCWSAETLAVECGRQQTWVTWLECRLAARQPKHVKADVAEQIAKAVAGSGFLISTDPKTIYTFLMGGDPEDLMTTLTFPARLVDVATPRRAPRPRGSAAGREVDLGYCLNPATEQGQRGRSRANTRDTMREGVAHFCYEKAA